MNDELDERDEFWDDEEDELSSERDLNIINQDALNFLLRQSIERRKPGEKK